MQERWIAVVGLAVASACADSAVPAAPNTVTIAVSSGTRPSFSWDFGAGSPAIQLYVTYVQTGITVWAFAADANAGGGFPSPVTYGTLPAHTGSGIQPECFPGRGVCATSPIPLEKGATYEIVLYRLDESAVRRTFVP